MARTPAVWQRAIVASAEGRCTPIALTRAVGAAAGGAIGARMAQRVGQHWVRRAIIVIGVSSGAWLLVQRMRA